MGDTNIEWTDKTWNPWMGCEHVSPGCDNCYMFTDMQRWRRDPEVVTRTTNATFNRPLRWARNSAVRYIFTCSWSDFFISTADDWRADAWNIIRQTPGLTYQILTKRPVLIPRRLPADWNAGWPNCWLGVTVESRAYLGRLDLLRRIPAAMRFISFEPLLEDLGEIDLSGFHWAIIGGESGPKRRTCEVDWIRNVVRQCEAQSVAVFVKQDSAARPGQQGRLPENIWTLKDFPHLTAGAEVGSLTSSAQGLTGK
jgi:protein gp37